MANKHIFEPGSNLFAKGSGIEKIELKLSNGSKYTLKDGNEVEISTQDADLYELKDKNGTLYYLRKSMASHITGKTLSLGDLSKNKESVLKQINDERLKEQEKKDSPVVTTKEPDTEESKIKDKTSTTNQNNKVPKELKKQKTINDMSQLGAIVSGDLKDEKGDLDSQAAKIAAKQEERKLNSTIEFHGNKIVVGTRMLNAAGGIIDIVSVDKSKNAFSYVFTSPLRGKNKVETLTIDKKDSNDPDDYDFEDFASDQNIVKILSPKEAKELDREKMKGLSKSKESIKTKINSEIKSNNFEFANGFELEIGAKTTFVNEDGVVTYKVIGFDNKNELIEFARYIKGNPKPVDEVEILFQDWNEMLREKSKRMNRAKNRKEDASNVSDYNFAGGFELRRGARVFIGPRTDEIRYTVDSINSKDQRIGFKLHKKGDTDFEENKELTFDEWNDMLIAKDEAIKEINKRREEELAAQKERRENQVNIRAMINGKETTVLPARRQNNFSEGVEVWIKVDGKDVIEFLPYDELAKLNDVDAIKEKMEKKFADKDSGFSKLLKKEPKNKVSLKDLRKMQAEKKAATVKTVDTKSAQTPDTTLVAGRNIISNGESFKVESFDDKYEVYTLTGPDGKVYTLDLHRVADFIAGDKDFLKEAKKKKVAAAKTPKAVTPANIAHPGKTAKYPPDSAFASYKYMNLNNKSFPTTLAEYNKAKSFLTDNIDTLSLDQQNELAMYLRDLADRAILIERYSREQNGIDSVINIAEENIEEELVGLRLLHNIIGNDDYYKVIADEIADRIEQVSLRKIAIEEARASGKTAAKNKNKISKKIEDFISESATDTAERLADAENIFNNAKLSLEEKIKAIMELGVDSMVMHGSDTKIGKKNKLDSEDEASWYYSPDADLRLTINFLADSKFKNGLMYKNVEVTKKGTSTASIAPGIFVHFDTGGRKGLSLEKIGDQIHIYFDHHGEEVGVATSAAEIYKNFAVKMGVMDKDHSNRLLEYVNIIENGNLPRNYYFMKDAYNRSLVGLYNTLSLESIDMLLNDHNLDIDTIIPKSKYKVMVNLKNSSEQRSLGDIINGYNKVKKDADGNIINKADGTPDTYYVGGTRTKNVYSMNKVEEIYKTQLSSNTKSQTPEIGRFIYQNEGGYPQHGFFYARSMGFDSYLRYNETGNNLFINIGTGAAELKALLEKSGLVKDMQIVRGAMFFINLNDGVKEEDIKKALGIEREVKKLEKDDLEKEREKLETEKKELEDIEKRLKEIDDQRKLLIGNK